MAETAPDRLDRLCRQFVSLAKYEVDIVSIETTLPVAYEAKPNAKTYEFIPACGEGDSAVEAIDKWFGKLPTDPFDTLIWRVKPELVSERHFDTNSVKWRVFSRFAVVR
jgi:hypothetical protein